MVNRHGMFGPSQPSLPAPAQSSEQRSLQDSSPLFVPEGLPPSSEKSSSMGSQDDVPLVAKGSKQPASSKSSSEEEAVEARVSAEIDCGGSRVGAVRSALRPHARSGVRARVASATPAIPDAPEEAEEARDHYGPEYSNMYYSLRRSMRGRRISDGGCPAKYSHDAWPLEDFEVFSHVDVLPKQNTISAGAEHEEAIGLMAETPRRSKRAHLPPASSLVSKDVVNAIRQIDDEIISERRRSTRDTRKVVKKRRYSNLRFYRQSRSRTASSPTPAIAYTGGDPNATMQANFLDWTSTLIKSSAKQQEDVGKLQQQIRDLDATVASTKEELSDLQSSHDTLRSKFSEKDAKIKDMQTQLTNSKQKLDISYASNAETKMKHDQMTTHLKNEAKTANEQRDEIKKKYGLEIENLKKQFQDAKKQHSALSTTPSMPSIPTSQLPPLTAAPRPSALRKSISQQALEDKHKSLEDKQKLLGDKHKTLGKSHKVLGDKYKLLENTANKVLNNCSSMANMSFGDAGFSLVMLKEVIAKGTEPKKE